MLQKIIPINFLIAKIDREKLSVHISKFNAEDFSLTMSRIYFLMFSKQNIFNLVFWYKKIISKNFECVVGVESREDILRKYSQYFSEYPRYRI